MPEPDSLLQRKLNITFSKCIWNRKQTNEIETIFYQIKRCTMLLNLNLVKPLFLWQILSMYNDAKQCAWQWQVITQWMAETALFSTTAWLISHQETANTGSIVNARDSFSTFYQGPSKIATASGHRKWHSLSSQFLIAFWILKARDNWQMYSRPGLDDAWKDQVAKQLNTLYNNREVTTENC